MRTKVDKKTFQSIREAVSKKKDVLVWYLFNNHSIKASSKIDSIDEAKEEIIISPQAGSPGKMKKVISGFGTVNVFIPNLSLIFSSPFKSINEHGRITLGMPETSLFYDRRTDDRVVLGNVLWAEFTAHGKKIRKKIFDLSIGGMAIVFAKSERFKLPLGTIIEDASLFLEGSNTKINMRCKITNSLKLSPYLLDSCPYGGARISFQFLDMTKKQHEFVSNILISHVGLDKD